MTPSRRNALIGGGAILTAAVAGVLLGPLLGRRSSPAAALRAASFTDLSGRPRKLTEWGGKVLICNFWAPWCPPCRREIPMLIRLRSAWQAFGLEVIGIGLDSAANIGEFSRSAGIDYPILIPSGDAYALARDAGDAEEALPYTVVLDRSWRAVYTKLGELREASLRAKVDPLLRAPKARVHAPRESAAKLG